jgi:hypothetical protein
MFAMLPTSCKEVHHHRASRTLFPGLSIIKVLVPYEAMDISEVDCKLFLLDRKYLADKERHLNDIDRYRDLL